MAQPGKAWINITEMCNNRCSYCYAQNSLHDRRRMMPIEDIKNILDKLALLKIRRCIIIGGEPTLHPEIAEIYKYAKKNKIRISLVSNGSRFADEKFYKKLKDAGLPSSSIAFSMHASSPQDSALLTGSSVYFSLFSKGISNFVKQKLKLHVNIVISKQTVNKVVPMMDWLKEHHINHGFFNLASPAVSEKGTDSSFVLKFDQLAQTVEKIYKHAKKINFTARFLYLAPLCTLPKKLLDIFKKEGLIDAGCSIRNGSSVLFNIDGDVVPCNHLLDFPVMKKNDLDKYNSKRFLEVWNAPQMEFMREKTRVYRLEQCKTCPEIALCQGGGCPLFWFNKNIDTNFYKW
ncbi:radical SAM protein [Candidatus Roizmanbacteria bacterium]|nr:radical SAM protein [Candidatus Roizmanbacteria bacterium]